jgi:hypothetical protein
MKKCPFGDRVARFDFSCYNIPKQEIKNIKTLNILQSKGSPKLTYLGIVGFFGIKYLHHLATLFRASFRVTSTTQTEMYY